MEIEIKEGFVKIPVEISTVEDGKDNYVVLSCTNHPLYEHIGLVSQGKTFEEAEEKFIKLLTSHLKFGHESYRKLVCWQPLKIGPKGSGWFSIFGIHFYIRKGKGNKRGLYIPIINRNIWIFSSWKHYPRKQKK